MTYIINKEGLYQNQHTIDWNEGHLQPRCDL